jgi:chromosomal replication initiation ATPase DnaA
MTASQLPLDLVFRPAYGREDFLVTDQNAFAVHYIDNWPQEWGIYPALTLYGQKGCGKSHLAAVWMKKSNALFLSAKEFSALDLTEISDLIDGRRNLVIDRLDLLTGERDSEEKLFHLYNGFQQEGLSVLLLSHVAPLRLDFAIKDLASRLRAAPSAEIQPPDDRLFSFVFAKQLHDRGFKGIGEAEAKYAVSRMGRSWDELGDLVAAISQKASAEKKPVTVALIRDVILGMEGPLLSFLKEQEEDQSSRRGLDEGPANLPPSPEKR